MSHRALFIHRFRSALHLLGLCLALLATAARANYAEGLTALELDDYALAFKLFSQSAKAGDAKSQTRLGTMYEQGLGLAKNPKRAALWYEQAADGGEPEAQTHLARLYRNGKGIAKDEKKAVYWYARAAEQGLGIAQFFLGLMYETGRGTARDYVKAFKWLDLAATGGDEDAKIKRDRMKEEMSPRQIIDGKRLSLEFRLQHPELIIAQTQTDPVYQRDETVTLPPQPKSPAATDSGAAKKTVTGRLSQRELTRRIQIALAAKGFEPGPADGLPGRNTRNAIRAYRRSIGASPNGAINDGLLARLEQPARASNLPAPTAQESVARPSPRTPLSGSRLIKAVQNALAHSGFDPGPADGRMGSRTRNAIKRFQRERGLAANGKPSMALLSALETQQRPPASTVAEKPAKPEAPAPVLKGRDLVKAVQTELTRQDFEPGPVDGQMGSKTRRAIREFQRRQGLKANGKPSMSLLLSLRAQQPSVIATAPKTATAPVPVQAGSPSPGLIRSIQKGLNARGYDAGSADGKKGAKTRRAILKFQTDQGLAATGRPSDELFLQLRTAPHKKTGAGGKPTKALVRAIQTLLNALGYDAGPEDGLHGRRTVSAVREFQRDRNLIPNGIMNPDLLSRLKTARGG